MNTTNIFPLIEEATVYTFKVMTSAELLVGQVGKVNSLSIFFDMISSCISLDGEEFKGVMLLSIPPETFEKVVSSMLDEESDIEENISLSAEILNMIHGRMKTNIGLKGGTLGMARPRVLKGIEEIDAKNIGQAQAMPFVMDAEHGFFVTVILQEEAA